ncbi:putative chromatin regulator PHD family [Helianthus debilis subsp. tardiflorus]
MSSYLQIQESPQGSNSLNNTTVGLPQLVEEIQDKLIKGTVECMICYDMVKRSAPIWSCSCCFSIFHLHCIKKWAGALSSEGCNWGCPGCRSEQLMSSKDIRYVCFCGKRPDPPWDPYLTPHSCGEPCEKEIDSRSSCPHRCVLQCHPGPCPPCKAFAPPRICPCGKSDASCFCNKNTETAVVCGEVMVKGEVNVEEDGVFSCSLPCGKPLACGNHVCNETCHPGVCGECDLLPAKLTSCSCGKTSSLSLHEKRRSCLDPILTCSQVCGKVLPCGLHGCKVTCHPGPCPPCQVMVTQKCRCGSTSRSVECFMEIDTFTCDKPCGRKKNCGRHRCSDKCCPLSDSNNAATHPHFCSKPCEKKLRCGQHDCGLLCHSGHCPPCPEIIFTDLTCACGRSSIPPPLACGMPPPSCQHPCSVPKPCGHVSSHSCHFGDCPPCLAPIPKECIGGHGVLRNIPCFSKDIRSQDITCNKPCGKTRKCGMHACLRTCHPAPCDSTIGAVKASCGQTCRAPRRDCRHTCTSLCHPEGTCPDVTCEFPVKITCGCGRITTTVPCDAGGNTSGYNADYVLDVYAILKLPLQRVEEKGKKIPLGQRKLMCDDECVKIERKKVLADAFGEIKLNFGENPDV